MYRCTACGATEPRDCHCHAQVLYSLPRHKVTVLVGGETHCYTVQGKPELQSDGLLHFHRQTFVAANVLRVEAV